MKNKTTRHSHISVFAAVLLSAAMAVSFCACGGDNGSANTNVTGETAAGREQSDSQSSQNTNKNSTAQSSQVVDQSSAASQEEQSTTPPESSTASEEVSQPNIPSTPEEDDISCTVEATVREIDMKLTDEQKDTLAALAVSCVSDSYVVSDKVIPQRIEQAKGEGICVGVTFKPAKKITVYYPDSTHTDELDEVYLLLTDEMAVADVHGWGFAIPEKTQQTIKDILGVTDEDTDREAVFDIPDITSEQLMAIPKQSTYGNIIRMIGYGADFGQKGLMLYRVDGSKILAMSFDKVDDICYTSGEEMAAHAVDMTPTELAEQKLSEPDSTWYYGLIVGNDCFYSESHIGDNFYYLDYPENCDIHHPDGTKASMQDVYENGGTNRLVLVHIKEVAEIYPPIASCDEIIVVANEIIVPGKIEE